MLKVLEKQNKKIKNKMKCKICCDKKMQKSKLKKFIYEICEFIHERVLNKIHQPGLFVSIDSCLKFILTSV